MGRKKSLNDCRSGIDIVKYTERQGVSWRNGKGSHMVGSYDEYRFVVPLHRELKNGTRNAIIKAFAAIGITGIVLAYYLLFL